MKKILVDTNVLLSYLTERDLQQQALAAELFAAASARQLELVVHQVALCEMVFVLQRLYNVAPLEVSAILSDLLAMPGVRAVDELSWSEVVRRWPTRIPDFGDAVLATVGHSSGIDQVATFDRAFRQSLEREGLALFPFAD